MKIEETRKNCLIKNKFSCDDYHCMHYEICKKESEEAFKEEWENLMRKRREEEEAIKEIIKGVIRIKGYCPICNKVIDEVEYTQFGMCEGCYREKNGKFDQCLNCGCTKFECKKCFNNEFYRDEGDQKKLRFNIEIIKKRGF